MAEKKATERPDLAHEANALAHELSRRGLLQRTVASISGASLGGLGIASFPESALAQAEAKSNDVSVPEKGGEYKKVSLKKDVVTIAAIQSRVRAVDGNNPGPGKRDNLNHMLDLIDKAQFYGGPKDLLCFHEFPITGWTQWDRTEIERVAIEIPGEETAAISKKAKEYGCYIKFGSYAKDSDWPGHILSLTTIIDPQGEVIARDWKARNIKGLFFGFELFTTTIYNVLDQYIEMYGADAVIPINHTAIGNIATSSVQREPELFRCMALKGCELLLRTATGGFEAEDIRMNALYNGVYSVIVNNAVSPNNRDFFPDQGGRSGGTAIYGPRGETLAKAGSKFEQAVVTRIPIAEYRKNHRIPDVHMDLYMPVFETYTPRYGSNLFSEYLPDTLKDAARYLASKDRWT